MASNTTPSIVDYIIVGGGTAGLVVASRLSEDPQTQVLVLESGSNISTDPRVQDVNGWLGLLGSDLDWNFKTIPQPGMNGREYAHGAGKALGGTSAINGMAFTPPAPAGIDGWAKLGNPRWTWTSLVPYLRKSYTITCPDPSICSDIAVDEKSSASGPIQVTYPALEKKKNHVLIQAWNNAFKEMGFDYTGGDILAEEKTIGSRPYTASIDPNSGYRSSADVEYGALASKRGNVTITTEATVLRVLFSSSESENWVATGVDVLVNGQTATIQAAKEVILAAGTFNTPKLLELSGIGDKDRLTGLGIPVVIDNPGVGENLQNHLMSLYPVSLNSHPDLEGITPGIYAIALIRLDPDEQEKLLNQHISSPRKPHEKAIQSIIEQPNEASALLYLWVMPGNGCVLGMIPCFPFSRGSTHISSADPNAKPITDPRFFSHDLDIEIMARHAQTLHNLPSAPALQPYFQQGSRATDLEATKKFLREEGAEMAHHACGTAPMLPREDGGVVDQDLKVYETENVRVVDASVFPLISSANPMATMYAVAERAADLIREFEDV
ncbi:Dehydrogenase [Aspergillus sclerotialis]|uniref:Dehydrogenase n=1 Tax=Aspergillus sclerotialis TaxID=2070753 RepID=A0A3A2ZAH3_9EURO|nr:Dehydrogenase [Aspergillus sclerotialis]